MRLTAELWTMTQAGHTVVGVTAPVRPVQGCAQGRRRAALGGGCGHRPGTGRGATPRRRAAGLS